MNRKGGRRASTRIVFPSGCDTGLNRTDNHQQVSDPRIPAKTHGWNVTGWLAYGHGAASRVAMSVSRAHQASTVERSPDIPVNIPMWVSVAAILSHSS